MKQAERDELAVAQVQLLQRLVETLEGPARVARQRRAVEEVEAGDPPLRRFLVGAPGFRAMLAGVPQFAGFWERVVPPEHVSWVCSVNDHAEWPCVKCPCGAATTLETYQPRACVGECGRWFVALESGVRVYRPREVIA